MQNYCVLIFPTLAQVRAFYQRPEWRELAAHLTAIEPTHWRLAGGGDLYVLTATSEQIAPVVQMEKQDPKVYLFRSPETSTGRWPYLLRMLASLHRERKIHLEILDPTVALDWQRLGILPPQPTE